MAYYGDSFSSSEESDNGDDDHEEDVSAVCSACERVFERGDNWRANNHNMEQHRQVRVSILNHGTWLLLSTDWSNLSNLSNCILSN